MCGGMWQDIRNPFLVVFGFPEENKFVLSKPIIEARGWISLSDSENCCNSRSKALELYSEATIFYIYLLFTYLWLISDYVASNNMMINE